MSWRAWKAVMNNFKWSRATFRAKEALSLALFQIEDYKDKYEDIGFAYSNIEGVLDQVCGFCPLDIRLFGQDGVEDNYND